jgi:hypothetical protein
MLCESSRFFREAYRPRQRFRGGHDDGKSYFNESEATHLTVYFHQHALQPAIYTCTEHKASHRGTVPSVGRRKRIMSRDFGRIQLCGYCSYPFLSPWSNYIREKQMLTILEAIVGWGIVAFVGTNLIGLIVRGLIWSPPAIEASTERVRELLIQESKRLTASNAAMTVLCLLLAAGYLFALYYFWNVWMAIAAVLIMTSRIPDLIWEIRNGNRISPQNCPRGAFYLFTTLLLWGALPIIWYSFFTL